MVTWIMRGMWLGSMAPAAESARLRSCCCCAGSCVGGYVGCCIAGMGFGGLVVGVLVGYVDGAESIGRVVCLGRW